MVKLMLLYQHQHSLLKPLEPYQLLEPFLLAFETFQQN